MPKFYYDTQPTECKDKYGIVWHERYNIYSASIGGIVGAEVAYHEGGYKIEVGGLTLKKRTNTPQEGMELAVSFIRKQLGFLLNVVE